MGKLWISGNTWLIFVFGARSTAHISISTLLGPYLILVGVALRSFFTNSISKIVFGRCLISSSSSFLNSRSQAADWFSSGCTSSVVFLIWKTMLIPGKRHYLIDWINLFFKELLELWGRGVQGRNRVSPHPSPPSATHSLTIMTWKCFATQGGEAGWCCLCGIFFVAGGCSQAVVGKSRTTGSIYLTSVSSTIAKHHQRASSDYCEQKPNMDAPHLEWLRMIWGNC